MLNRMLPTKTLYNIEYKEKTKTMLRNSPNTKRCVTRLLLAFVGRLTVADTSSTQAPKQRKYFGTAAAAGRTHNTQSNLINLLLQNQKINRKRNSINFSLKCFLKICNLILSFIFCSSTFFFLGSFPLFVRNFLSSQWFPQTFIFYAQNQSDFDRSSNTIFLAQFKLILLTTTRFGIFC